MTGPQPEPHAPHELTLRMRVLAARLISRFEDWLAGRSDAPKKGELDLFRLALDHGYNKGHIVRVIHEMHPNTVREMAEAIQARRSAVTIDASGLNEVIDATPHQALLTPPTLTPGTIKRRAKMSEEERKAIRREKRRKPPRVPQPLPSKRKG